MKDLTFPLSEKDARALRIGDKVRITGKIVTARDAAHKYMTTKSPKWLKQLLADGCIYHCGPVCRKTGSRWEVLAAGPTTSIREEPYQATVIDRFKVRAIIGKGGMGPKTLAGLKATGAVYLHAVGGAASLLADRIIEVEDVFMYDEFGAPEAFWVFRVEGFPAIVTMDSHGGSLHSQVADKSRQAAQKLLKLQSL